MPDLSTTTSTPSNTWSGGENPLVTLALESSLLAHARWKILEDFPDWVLIGSQAFKLSGEKLALSASYLAMRGYHTSLKICLAGLTLVSDMAVNCFLTG